MNGVPSKHWCPIEKRECGNFHGRRCEVGGDQWFAIDNSFGRFYERCPYPNSIKEVAPDPTDAEVLKAILKLTEHLR